MYVTKAITAQNTWTDVIELMGFFNYSAQGTFDATITLQRTFDNGTTWEDIDSDTASFSLVGFEPLKPFGYSKPHVKYRLGVKTGEFSSGTANVRLGIR